MLTEVLSFLNNLHIELAGENGDQLFEALRNLLQDSELQMKVSGITKKFGVVPEIPKGEKLLEINGMTYVKVVSHGWWGKKWIDYFESKDIHLSEYAKGVLRSPNFKYTENTIYTLAICRGMSFTDKGHITRKIRTDAEKRGWLTPYPEIVCLLRCLFSDAELTKLGLWWISNMREQIRDSGSHLVVINLYKWVDPYIEICPE